MKKTVVLSVIMWAAVFMASAQSEVWKADLGNGKYQNPIIYADYSDPDVCVGPDGYYMTASSFNCIPGLPILFSTDLVNWTIVSHALQVQVPEEVYNLPQHGNGVWAPAIRYHEGEFYIYWGDPDFGIYMVKTKDAKGEWEAPVLVKAGKGMIDTCPFWDEDGQVYLSYAFAGSRRGLKSVLLMTRLTADGTAFSGQPRIIYDGHQDNPTCEGTKLYKHEGKYYILCPAGGVATGWQLALRADDPFGPWEARKVMEQGKTDINGPHQGGWVRTPEGEDWFIHFQDVGPVGRITHLNPMVWKEGWPVIGEEKKKDNLGNPVRKYAKPAGLHSEICTPQESDEFDRIELGKQWQFQANIQPEWYFIDSKNSCIRLYSAELKGEKRSLWDAANLMLQKFPAPDFTATAKVKLVPNEKNAERGGLVVMGMDYCAVNIEQDGNQFVLRQRICKNADRQGLEKVTAETSLKQNNIYLRVKVTDGNQCQFSYSLNGRKFMDFGEKFAAREGKWIGAKVGLYCTRMQASNDGGWLEADNFIISK